MPKKRMRRKPKRPGQHDIGALIDRVLAIGTEDQLREGLNAAELAVLNKALAHRRAKRLSDDEPDGGATT